VEQRIRHLRLDLLFYLVCLVFALVTAIWSEFYGYRVWGNFAVAGYLLALGHTAWLMSRPARSGVLGSRWTPVAVAGMLAVVAPLAVLVVVRPPAYVWGPWPWSFPSQPEVWVVERSASLLLANGTPYLDLATLDRPVHPDDYSPYGPVMALFGLPRAVLGDSPITDARLMFVAVSALVMVLVLRVLGWPVVPIAAAQLTVICPLTTLTATVAGDDLPVIALIILATALVYRTHPAWPALVGALVGALVVCIKLTALPALVVLAVAVLAHRGARALAAFLGTAAATGAVVIAPVLAANPAAFVEHVILYPAGLGQAGSPAASPLPGHLIAQSGPAGHAVAMGLLAMAACMITAWLVLRPPRTAADGMVRISAGLGAAILLAPASRWGYLVYPVAMLGAMVGFSAVTTESNDPTAESHAHSGTPVGSPEPVGCPDTH
jgi:hypothetical protein